MVSVLPPQRQWMCIPGPPAICLPMLAQACCPGKPPSDPLPATCWPSLSPVWLSVSLTRCSLSGIPHWGLGNSWHPWPGSRPGTGCWFLSSPEPSCRKGIREALSPPPPPAQVPSGDQEERGSASCQKSSHLVCVLTRGDDDMVLFLGPPHPF